MLIIIREKPVYNPVTMNENLESICKLITVFIKNKIYFII